MTLYRMTCSCVPTNIQSESRGVDSFPRSNRIRFISYRFHWNQNRDWTFFLIDDLVDTDRIARSHLCHCCRGRIPARGTVRSDSASLFLRRRPVRAIPSPLSAASSSSKPADASNTHRHSIRRLQRRWFLVCRARRSHSDVIDAPNRQCVDAFQCCIYDGCKSTDEQTMGFSLTSTVQWLRVTLRRCTRETDPRCLAARREIPWRTARSRVFSCWETVEETRWISDGIRAANTCEDERQRSTQDNESDRWIEVR